MNIDEALRFLNDAFAGRVHVIQQRLDALGDRLTPAQLVQLKQCETEDDVLPLLDYFEAHPGQPMPRYATMLLVVRIASTTDVGYYDELEREALAAAGIPRQPTEESMFLSVKAGVTEEAVGLGAEPSDWEA